MTDDLETDVRAMLAARAATVTVDPAAGEQAIADRLADGDHALAEVVPLAAAPSHRSRWLLAAAAAVLVIALVAAGLVLRDSGDQVDTGPVAPPPSSTAPTLELAPILQSGACDELGVSAVPSSNPSACFLVGERIDLTEHIEATDVVQEPGDEGPLQWGVSVTPKVTAGRAVAAMCGDDAPGCQDGQLAVLLDDRVVTVIEGALGTFEIRGIASAEGAAALAAALLGEEVSDQTTTTESVEVAGGPLQAQAGESAKDLAERVALQVFGEELVTVDVTEEAGDAVLVLLEDSRGDRLHAAVATNLTPPRLQWISSPGIDDSLEGRTDDDNLIVEVPAAGRVEIAGLNEQLRQVRSTVVDKPEGAGFEVDGTDWTAKVPYLVFTLVGDDGRTYRLLAPAGD